MNYSSMDPSHGLQFKNCSRMGLCNRLSSFWMDCSSTAPPWAAVPARIRVPACAPLHRLQILVGCCFCVGSPWTAVSFSMYPSAAVWGPPWAAVCVSALMWYTMGCKRTAYATIVFSMGQGIFSSTWSISSPPSSLTLVSAGLFFSSFLLQLLHSNFYPFLNT